MNGAQFVSDFGDLAVVLPVAALVLVWLLRTPGSRPMAVAWVIAVAFCAGAIGLLKIYFSVCSTGIVGSPSGHVATSILVYGGLALTIAVRWRRMTVPAALAGAGLVGALAVSRVVIGAHDIAEVLIGAAIGAAALAIFAKTVVRDRSAVPAKPILASAVLAVVLLHGQQVQAEQLIRVLGRYLHAQQVGVCL